MYIDIENRIVEDSKKYSELMYIVKNSPTNIVCKNRELIFMNGLWYTGIDGKIGNVIFQEYDFHNALKWLVDPFWYIANGHYYGDEEESYFTIKT